MAHIRIEMDRGDGWEVRAEGPWTPRPQNPSSQWTEAKPPLNEEIVALLVAYAIQYPHRAFLDGVLVAEQAPQIKRRRR